MTCDHKWKEAEWQGPDHQTLVLHFCGECGEFKVERIYPPKEGPRGETFKAIANFFHKLPEIKTLEQFRSGRFYSTREIARITGVDERQCPLAIKIIQESKLNINGQVGSVKGNGLLYFRDDPEFLAANKKWGTLPFGPTRGETLREEGEKPGGGGGLLIPAAVIGLIGLGLFVWWRIHRHG